MSSLPRTLLQIAGAQPHPTSLENAALVLIDHQLEYLSGALSLTGIHGAVAECSHLLELARRHQIPVFHVVHHGRRGSPVFDPDGQYVAIMHELVPHEGEVVVIKSLPNAFAGTNLHVLIQERARKELIICGFATHMCVSTTARAALDLGYRTTIVAAATATRDLPSADGSSLVPADVLQQATLAALADRFAVIVPNAASIEALS